MSFPFIKCNEQQKSKKTTENSISASVDKIGIELTGFDDKNVIVYKTTKADFFFSRLSILEYCKNKDTAFSYNHCYTQAINYLAPNDAAQIIIPDTLGTKLVPSKTVFTYSESDTLVRIRNQESPYSYVTDAIEWMMLDLIETGKLRILEHKSNKFIDSIILKEVNSDGSGSKNLLTTKGEKLFSKMTWIE